MSYRSTWGTHERTCPRKNWQSYCDVCHKLVRNDKKEDHKELCMEHAHTSQQHASAVSLFVLIIVKMQ